MLRVKRMICIFLLVVMTVSLLPKEALAMSAVTPSQSGVTSSKYFTAQPGVYEMGDGYAVIWATSFKGTGYIKYTYQGRSYTVYDQRNGIVRTNDTMHVVKVPYEHLQGNSYTVYSTEVTSHSYALTYYGTTISAGPITLKAYDGGEDDFDVLVLTDTHKQKAWTVKAAQWFSEDPDLVLFTGDIVDHINTKADIELMFDIMGSTTGGRYPIVYCRGNHETRGVYSTKVLEYFPTETGEFYFDFRYGPLWGVVIDTGEDKDDTHYYYGNLANYKEYNQKQEAWLRNLRMDETATYRLGIYHIAQINQLANGLAFTDSVEHLGLQLAVAGHDHRCQWRAPGIHAQYGTFVAGGYAPNAATWVTMNNRTGKAYITAKTSATTTYSHSTYGSYNNYTVDLSPYVGAIPEPLEVPERGTNALFKPSTSPAGTVSIAVQPTVFETGGDWYNVVWTSNITSTAAAGSAGYVEYTYNGTTYQQFTESGGYRAGHSTIYTVKVPKEHLNNNTYKVGTFLVEFSYTNATNKTGLYYSAGDYVESPQYLFENKIGDEAVNLVVCPDIKTNDGDTSKAAAAAANAVAALGTSPTYVIVNGDTVNATLNSNADLAVLFSATAAVSGGIHPVIFSRGNSECRGYNATDLIKYIPTVTGEFYYSLDVGDYTLVNVDTAEDDLDDAKATVSGSTVSKFGGRVFLEDLRQKQVSWINSLSSGKIVAISHIPFSTVSSKLGVDFTTPLKNKGAVLVISGHNNSSNNNLVETVNSSSIYTVIPGGTTGTNTNTSASIILADHYAYIDDCKYAAGTVSRLAQKAVDLTTGSTLSITASKPSLSGTTYTVSTPGHLKWIADNCTSTDNFSGYTFRLANDIDLKLVPFTPIGGNDSNALDSNATSKAFSGTFDGNGYTIKNLNINSTSNNVGLFGVLRKGTIQNLTVSGGIVSGGWYVGGLVGYSTVGVIEDCYIDLIVCAPSGTKVGGIAGMTNGGTQVTRCANFGSVSAHHPQGSAGGIVGQINGATASVLSSCYNRGNIAAHGLSGTSGGSAGGIFGYNYSSSVTVQNCYNAASVNAKHKKGAISGNFGSGSKTQILNTAFALGYNGATTGTSSGNTWSSNSGKGSISAFSQSSMKSQDFANLLSSADFTYVAPLNDGYPVHFEYVANVCASGHTYTSVVTAPTCTTQGCTTYTCFCGDSYTADWVAATGHNYIWGVCSVCGAKDSSYVEPDYYLFTSLDGTMHGYDEVVSDYKFVNGQLSLALNAASSYVAVRTGDDDCIYYQTNGWQSNGLTSVTLYDTQSISDAGNSAGMLEVPAKTYMTFTLTQNSDGTLTLSYKTIVCSHNYVCIARTEPTCTTDGEATYQCRICWNTYTKTLTATGHSYIWDTCSVCGNVDEDYVTPTYYLFGNINGEDYACEGDAENIGTYQFVDGKLTTGFLEDSYVAVKTGDNGKWYMTNGWQGFEATSATLYNTNTLGTSADKLYIPAKTYITFTLTENADGTLTLSYERTACNHSYECIDWTDPTCTTDGEASYECSICWGTYTQTLPATGHNYIWDTCSVCGSVDATYEIPTYYLYGYINGADYASESDYMNMGIYEFVDGKLTATFTQESYVGVKTENNGIWYVTDGYLGKVTSGIMHDATTITTDEKMYVPGNQHLVFTLTHNEDGTLTLSYEIDADNHSYTSVTTDPTCTQDGYTTYTCLCGHTYTADTVTAYGHSWIEATCTTVQTCAVCGVTEGKALGHSWEDATCTTAKTCIACGKIEGTALGHSWITATCTSPKTCSTCGTTEGSALGHAEVIDAAVAATCTETGLTEGKHCSVCDKVLVAQEVVAAKGHTEVVDNAVAATCTETGLTEGKHCSVCDKVLVAQEVVAATGTHIFENGSCIYGCGTTETVAPEALKFAGATLKLEENLTVLFMVDSSLITTEGYENPYVVCSINGVKSTIDTYTTSGRYYVYAFEDIAPQQMNDMISATLYATHQGTTYESAAVQYSVSTYCYNTLKRNTNAKLRTLLVDLLNYGAAAQLYRGYNTDHLVNADLTETQKAWGTQTERTLTSVTNAAYKQIESPSVNWTGAGLKLTEAVEMYFVIQAADVSNLSVKIADDNGWIATIPGSELVSAGNGLYYIYFSGLNAGQMSKSVYLTVYEGSTPVSNTLRYSIESYVYKYQNSTDTKLANLVKAMMKYGDSAYAYIH